MFFNTSALFKNEEIFCRKKYEKRKLKVARYSFLKLLNAHFKTEVLSV